jgi:polyhydroxybutyrate depolymerase
VGTESRTYTYYTPTSSSQAPALVFVLHGTTQDGAQIMNISAFNDIAETNHFIAVYPDGVGNIWNVGFDIPGASTADDLGFIEALVDKFVNEFGADATRVYSCGFSAGGYMSHRLACESSRCFAAIASVSGTMSPAWGDTCAPAYLTSVMQIHGTSDLVVPYNGGTSTTGYSVPQVLEKWQTILSCDATPSVTDLPDVSLLDLSTVQKENYNNCSSNYNLTLLKVNSGGHMWPGTDVILSGIGTINRDINASQEIWDFFSNHQCPANVDITENGASQLFFTLTPDRQFSVQSTFSIPRQFNVVNAMGSLVLKGKTQQQIDLSSISNGLYIVSVDGYNPTKVVLN